jgi:hypothetical protein
MPNCLVLRRDEPLVLIVVMLDTFGKEMNVSDIRTICWRLNWFF